ncbi:unnamed protein product [Schistosoma guineensis]|nr:unnamed protein product [Schistosoma guineensis]
MIFSHLYQCTWTTADTHLTGKMWKSWIVNSKNTGEFLEAWQSGQSAINKHIEIDPIYQPIRKIMHGYLFPEEVAYTES